jgi:hypothetical protein
MTQAWLADIVVGLKEPSLTIIDEEVRLSSASRTISAGFGTVARSKFAIWVDFFFHGWSVGIAMGRGVPIWIGVANLEFPGMMTYIVFPIVG